MVIVVSFGQGIENDKKQRELREQTRCVASTIENNDFDYEDKQKAQDSVLVYEGLHFNLAGENSKCTCYPTIGCFFFFFLNYVMIFNSGFCDTSDLLCCNPDRFVFLLRVVSAFGESSGWMVNSF